METWRFQLETAVLKANLSLSILCSRSTRSMACGETLAGNGDGYAIWLFNFRLELCWIKPFRCRSSFIPDLTSRQVRHGRWVLFVRAPAQDTALVSA